MRYTKPTVVGFAPATREIAVVTPMTPTARSTSTARRTPLAVDVLAVDSLRRLMHGFRQSRMRVDRADHLLGRRFEPEEGAALRDELGGMRADDVDAEDLVVLRVGDDLHEAFLRRLHHRLGAVSYTHLRAHETVLDIVCRLL